MPVEGLIDHPEINSLPAIAIGMLIRLMLHYWHTECRPLPSGVDLKHVARTHSPSWKTWGETILKIFNDVKPEMDRYYSARENNVSSLSLSRMKSARVRRELKAPVSAQLETTAPISALAIVPKRQQEKRAQAVAERAQSETDFVDA